MSKLIRSELIAFSAFTALLAAMFGFWGGGGESPLGALVQGSPLAAKGGFALFALVFLVGFAIEEAFFSVLSLATSYLEFKSGKKLLWVYIAAMLAVSALEAGLALPFPYMAAMNVLGLRKYFRLRAASEGESRKGR